jgi:antitoxin (DNA-binding transcriptional repressor) of toxin-antitoxin stability system
VTATITEFRKDLFQLADRALKGEPVEFVYRGVVFKVTPEKKQSKLAKLVGQPVLAGGVDLEQASKELLSEMEAEWLQDWSEL